MLLIKGAEVYAPEYLGKKDVLIAGEKIERIGEDLPEYEGCQVIDGTGRIVARDSLTAMSISQAAAVREASTHRLPRCSFLI